MYGDLIYFISFIFYLDYFKFYEKYFINQKQEVFSVILHSAMKKFLIVN